MRDRPAARIAEAVDIVFYEQRVGALALEVDDVTILHSERDRRLDVALEGAEDITRHQNDRAVDIAIRGLRESKPRREVIPTPRLVRIAVFGNDRILLQAIGYVCSAR